MPLFRKIQLWYDLACNNYNIVTAKTISFNSEIAITPSAGTATVDWTAGQYQKVTLNAAPVTLSFTAPKGPGKFTLRLLQDGSGSRTVSWASISPLYWQSKTAPTLTSAAGSTDFVVFYYDGYSYWGSYGLNWG